MGKKDKKKNGYKSGKLPKGASVDPAGLSKKERKELEARAAALEAKLAEKAERKAAKKAAAKAEKKAGKKGKAAPVVADVEVEGAKALKKKAKADKLRDATESPKAKTIAAADDVLAAPGNDETVAAAKTAKAAALEAADGETDEEIRARVLAKRQARADLLETADAIDRADGVAVAAYNAALLELGGGTFLTSDDEKAKTAADPKGDKPRKAKATELVVEIEGETLAAPEQVVEVVETERGTVYEAGTAEASQSAEEFAKPSDAPVQLEAGRNGYKIIQLDKDGKPDPRVVRQMTRVTTYIDNLEDKTSLVLWKLRTLVEGLALDTLELGADGAGRIITEFSAIMHRRDVALAKAAKADRKGKLAVGERAELESAALKEFKAAANKLADDALELGGVHVKADRGTNLHALAELYDAEGLAPINAMLKAEEITPTDHASIVAYAEACINADIKMLESEVVVVNDERKNAGRLDRTALVKLPGSARAIRVVADIKSGSLDFGQGKLAQQLESYASAKAYDLETGERRDLKLSKRYGLVIHLPQGAGTCHIYVVDLALGAKGNKLSAEVRAWRNESKKAIDFSVDLGAAKVAE